MQLTWDPQGVLVLLVGAFLSAALGPWAFMKGTTRLRWGAALGTSLALSGAAGLVLLLDYRGKGNPVQGSSYLPLLVACLSSTVALCVGRAIRCLRRRMKEGGQLPYERAGTGPDKQRLVRGTNLFVEDLEVETEEDTHGAEQEDEGVWHFRGTNPHRLCREGSDPLGADLTVSPGWVETPQRG